jgi:quercetin dioxygenase-like cupin family protein
MKWLLFLVIGALIGSALTLTAQTAQTQRIGSTVFDWEKLAARPTAVGSVRSVVRAPTRTLDELEMHITTLNPGAESHPPHQHPAEELLIVKEGQVETLQNGKATRCGPGSIIFHASNDLHNIRNVGSTPATYHVVQWKVPGAEK